MTTDSYLYLAFLISATILANGAAGQSPPQPAHNDIEWASYSGDPGGMRYSRADQIRLGTYAGIGDRSDLSRFDLRKTPKLPKAFVGECHTNDSDILSAYVIRRVTSGLRRKPTA